MPKPGHVYVMRVDEERVKVGYSVDPSRRLKESDLATE